MGTWFASLSLEFERAANQTFLARQKHQGPLRVQRPFLETNGTCQVYLIHPPGGVVGGDQLEIKVDVRRGAEALLTSPGATKFYRTPGEGGRQSQQLLVKAEGSLEWLPQETILFNGAHAESRTRVDLEPGARFAGWEITALGRPASGEQFLRGEWRQCFEVWRDGSPLWLERARYQGSGVELQARWGLGGHSVTGSFVVVPAERLPDNALDTARAALDSFARAPNEQLSATQLDGVLLCRYLGASTHRAREIFSGAWRALRPSTLGRQAEPPRIWTT
jgi:urease accessory protein